MANALKSYLKNSSFISKRAYPYLSTARHVATAIAWRYEQSEHCIRENVESVIAAFYLYIRSQPRILFIVRIAFGKILVEHKWRLSLKFW